MSPPFFSILVPVYNHERFIAAALDSLLAQTDPDWEALVVNDGSTDGTPEIIEDYARRDSRIRVFHKANGGQPTALNEGLKNSLGEWICWLSSDDLFLPDKLAIHRQSIEAHPDSRFFYTGFQMLEDETGSIKPPYVDHTPDQRWQVLDLLSFNYINGITICVHRKMFGIVGLFDDSNRFGQDYDLFLRLLTRTPAVRVQDHTCLMRTHAGQFTRTENSSMFYDCASAAISFLNRTPFSGLFPRLDLSDETQILMAVDRALDVAMSPDALVNRLGPHPLLFAKIMEWVWKQPGSMGRRLGELVEWRVIEAASCGRPGSRWQGFWRAAALFAATNPALPAALPCTPFDVADAALADHGARGDAEEDAVRRYIERRQGRQAGAATAARPGPRDLVVDDGVTNGIVCGLARRGWRVTQLDAEADGFNVREWGWTVGVRSARRSVSAALAAVPLWDAAVTAFRSGGDLAVASRTRPLPVGDGSLDPLAARLDALEPSDWRTQWIRLLRRGQWHVLRKICTKAGGTP